MRGEQRRRHDALVLPRSHCGERDRQQRAADAIADGMDFLFAGRLFDRVERGERDPRECILPSSFARGARRIDPGDAKDGDTLIDAPLDEGFFRRQVEHVIFVDPGRHDQQRLLEHLLGRRRILDELHDVVLEDHFAGRYCQIAADLEHRGIGLANLQIAAAGLRCRRQACACRARGSRRCWSSVSRSSSGLVRTKFDGDSRVGDLPHIELGLLPGVRIEVVGVADQLIGPAAGEQIGLLEEIEELVRASIPDRRSVCRWRRAQRPAAPVRRRAAWRPRPIDRDRPCRAGSAARAVRCGSASQYCATCPSVLATSLSSSANSRLPWPCLARLEIGGERPAAFFDHARKIARERSTSTAPIFTGSCDGARTSVSSISLMGSGLSAARPLQQKWPAQFASARRAWQASGKRNAAKLSIRLPAVLPRSHGRPCFYHISAISDSYGSPLGCYL